LIHARQPTPSRLQTAKNTDQVVDPTVHPHHPHWTLGHDGAPTNVR
jgi:hypothetical protein